MYTSILVPLDGSHTAGAALATAADIARRSGARLHLARVVSWLNELTDMSTASSPRRYVTRVAEQTAKRFGIDVEVAMLSDAINGVAYGDPPRRAIAEVLDHHAAGIGADLTVMTTHGRGGFKRLWIGSVADSMLRMSNGSVLMLKSRRPVRSRIVLNPKRILVPVSATHNDEELVARAVELGELYEAEFTLLHVAPPILSFATMDGVESLLESGAESARTFMEHMSNTLEETGHRVRTALVTMPFIASEIIAYADDHQFDLIAVSTRGPNWYERAILGSVSDKVLRGSTLPVLSCNTSIHSGRGRH